VRPTTNTRKATTITPSLSVMASPYATRPPGVHGGHSPRQIQRPRSLNFTAQSTRHPAARYLSATRSSHHIRARHASDTHRGVTAWTVDSSHTTGKGAAKWPKLSSRKRSAELPSTTRWSASQKRTRSHAVASTPRVPRFSLSGDIPHGWVGQ
jgi:hypothetical protein